MNSKNRKSCMLATAIVTAATLGACGDSDGQSGGDSGGRFAGIDGTASKGIIVNADVTATELGSDAVLGTAITDEKGEYDISVVGHNGAPIRLTLTAQADSATTMICDVSPNCGMDPSTNLVVAFGEPISLPDDFELSSIIPAANGLSRTSAAITPLTTVAAARAETLANGEVISAANAESALSEISNLFGGVNVLRTPVVDFSDEVARRDASGTVLINSAFQAAIGQLAVSGNTSFKAAIDALAEELRDGVIPAETATQGSFSLKNINDAISTQLTAANESDSSGALAVMENSVSMSQDGNVDPQPSARAGEPRIERARALVAEIRNIGREVLRAEEPGQAYLDDLEAAYRLSESTAVLVGEDLGFLFDEIATELSENPNQTSFDITVNSTDSSANNAARSARAIINIGSNRVTGSISGEVGRSAINGQLSYPGETASGNRLEATFSGSVSTIDTSSDDALSLSIDTVRITANGSNITTEEDNAQAYSNGSAEMQFTVNQINSDVSFTGGFEFEAVRCPGCTDTQNSDSVIGIYNPRSASLNGVLAGNNGSSEISFTARLINATTFDPELDISDSNTPRATASFVSSASLGESDTLDYQVSLQAALTGYFGNENEDGSAPIGNVTLVLSRPSMTTRFQLSNRGDVSDTARLVISNQDGTSLVITPDEDVESGEGSNLGTIENDGARVATVSETDSGLVIVRYDDGSFETLQ